MKFITAMTYAGYCPESLWARVSVAGFLKHCPGELLVVNHAMRGDPNGTLEWLRSLPRVFVVEDPESDIHNGQKVHGSGYDRAFSFARECQIPLLVSLEADCEMTGGEWHAALRSAMTYDFWMAGMDRLAYGPLHHVPACYRTDVEWPTFRAMDMNSDKPHPRFSELMDLPNRIKNARDFLGERATWWAENTWDTGQRAWFVAAAEGKAQEVKLPNCDIRHFWHGTTKGPGESQLAQWAPELMGYCQ